MTTWQSIPAKRTPLRYSGVTPVQKSILQRKCACGGTPDRTGECEECRKKRLRLQSMAGNSKAASEYAFPVLPSVHDAIRLQSQPPNSGMGHIQEPRHVTSSSPLNTMTPDIVQHALRAPGQPLDPNTRAFMESRFGHDFSKVRIHSDAAAAESAHALNARAYNLGRDIVFGAGQYQSHSPEALSLLAHELTHVVQTEGSTYSGDFTITQPKDAREQEADRIAYSVMKTLDSTNSESKTPSVGIKPQMNYTGQARTSVARQAEKKPQRSRIQCINANLSNAGIPWALLALAGGVCGLLGAVAGLATGPGAVAASPSAAAVAAAYCISGVTGATAGMILGVITRCIQDPSVEWVFAQAEPGTGPKPASAPQSVTMAESTSKAA
jgi:hypothetical protein